MTNLTDAGREVLRIIALSDYRTDKPKYAGELARTLDKSQVAVFKNLQPLFDNKLLVVEPEFRGGKQYLKLTDKGALYAVSDCEVEYLEMLIHHPYLETDANSKQGWKFLESVGVAQIWAKTNADFSIANNLFDDNGGWLLDHTKHDITRYKHYLRSMYIEGIFRITEKLDLNISKKQLERLVDALIKMAPKYDVKEAEAKQILTVIRT